MVYLVRLKTEKEGIAAEFDFFDESYLFALYIKFNNKVFLVKETLEFYSKSKKEKGLIFKDGVSINECYFVKLKNTIFEKL